MSISPIQSKVDFFSGRLFSSLPPLQKKILIVVAIVFSCIAAIFMWRKSCFNAIYLKVLGKTSSHHELHAALMAGIQDSKATSKLYHQAEKALRDFNGKPLKIVIVDPEKVTFGACCAYSCGQIWISSGLDVKTAFSLCLFELANMTQAAQFDKYHKACLIGELTCDEYANEMEKVEHLSAFIHTTVIKHAIAEKGNDWSKFLRYEKFVSDPISYLIEQKANGHTDYYLKHYHQAIIPWQQKWLNVPKAVKEQPGEKSIAASAVDKASNPALFDYLTEWTYKAQSTAKLYRQAEKALKDFNGSSLRVVIVDPDKVQYGASCDWSKGEIWMSSSLAVDEAFSKFILMLASMTQVTQYSKIHQACTKKELSREDYAFEMEKIMYLSTFMHTTAIKYAIAEKGEEWRKHDHYHHSVLDPVTHMNRQKTFGVIDCYDKYWDQFYA